MSEIGSVQGVERPAPVAAPVPVAVPERAVTERPPAPLEPAVRVEIGRDAPAPAPETSPYRAQIVRDSQTRSMIYQVLDPRSGDIVVQLPSVVVLKARAYAEREAAQAADAARGQAKEGLDRTA